MSHMGMGFRCTTQVVCPNERLKKIGKESLYFEVEKFVFGLGFTPAEIALRPRERVEWQD